MMHFLVQMSPQITAVTDYDELLEVAESTTAEDIKKTYQRAAMKWHPDRNHGNEIDLTLVKLGIGPHKWKTCDVFGQMHCRISPFINVDSNGLIGAKVDRLGPVRYHTPPAFYTIKFRDRWVPLWLKSSKYDAFYCSFNTNRVARNNCQRQCSLKLEMIWPFTNNEQCSSMRVSFSPPVGRLLFPFGSGFDNIHPLTDKLRDFKDFNDKEIATLREFTSTTESCQALAIDTLQPLMALEESSSNSHEEWDGMKKMNLEHLFARFWIQRCHFDPSCLEHGRSKRMIICL
jgi:hypothetical protein